MRISEHLCYMRTVQFNEILQTYKATSINNILYQTVDTYASLQYIFTEIVLRVREMLL